MEAVLWLDKKLTLKKNLENYSGIGLYTAKTWLKLTSNGLFLNYKYLSGRRQIIFNDVLYYMNTQSNELRRLRNYLLEKELSLRYIKSLRRKSKLPIRGQRTRSNSKTIRRMKWVMAVPKSRVTKFRRRKKKYYNRKLKFNSCYNISYYNIPRIRVRGCMLNFYLLQLQLYSYIQLLFEVAILYNLIQMLRQENTIYFLGYFLFFIIYLGIWLLYLNLTIFCLILWMVYGGFLAIIFTLLLMWVDATRGKKNLNFGINFLKMSFLAFFILVVVSGNLSYWSELNIIPINIFFWHNYLEGRQLGIEEELEVLGWVIGYENLGGLYFSVFMLSLSCFVVVIVILAARRIKWVYSENSLLKGHLDKRYFKYTILKVQNFYMQERGSIGTPLRIFKVVHNRRI